MTPAKPFSTWISGSPSRLSFGMRALSKRITAVSDALMPSLCSSRSTVTPGCSRGTMNDLIAARPSDLSSVAHTTMWVAREPAVTKIFSPLMTYSSPSSTAVVDTAAESEPKLGSVIAIAAQTSLPSRSSCFVGRDAGDRGVAQALTRHRQQQRDIAPADLDRVEHAPTCCRRCGSRPGRRRRGTPRHRRTRSSSPPRCPRTGWPACRVRRGRRVPSGRTCARSAAASRRRPDAPSRSPLRASSAVPD